MKFQARSTYSFSPSHTGVDAIAMHHETLKTFQHFVEVSGHCRRFSAIRSCCRPVPPIVS